MLPKWTVRSCSLASILSCSERSRAWKGVGVIPVLDWFNASFADGANCTFQMRDGRFCYVTIKDVAVGDEFLWNYNNANAITTWLNYGYVDIERPTLAFLEIRIDDAQRHALERFAVQQLNLASNKNSTDTKVDKCLFQRELLTPGNLANGDEARRSAANSMKTFANARAWFRMLVLANEATVTGTISLATINSDGMPFGQDIETRVIVMMRAALKTGLAQLLARVTEFSSSEVGRSISMAPYVDMATQANKAWDKALELAAKICSASSLEACLPEINLALDLNVDSQAALESALTEIAATRHSLLASIVRAYV
jgi:SET domain